jgi:hypothetical protein
LISLFDIIIIEGEVSDVAEWERLQIEFEQMEELKQNMEKEME